jgi:hypothetical protein
MNAREFEENRMVLFQDAYIQNESGEPVFMAGDLFANNAVWG